MATPDETWDRFSPCMSRAGITRIASITGLDRIGIPVYVGVRPQSRGLTTSQGKGFSRAAAKVSALMESLEGWHGERVRCEAYLPAWEVLEETGAPPVAISALASATTQGPDEDMRMPWVRGRSLCSGTDVMVPYDAVSTDFTQTSSSPIPKTTNGLASGNSLAEAALHGLLEVVERDRLTQYIHGEIEARLIDLASVTDVHLMELCQRLSAAAVPVRAQILGRGTVTVCAAQLAPERQHAGAGMACFAGYGAHLDPHVALARALTEAIQSRATLISGSRDDLWPSHYATTLDPWVTDAWVAEFGHREPNVDFSEEKDESSETVEEDIDAVIDSIRGRALDVVCVDLSRLEMQVPVTKVVVPGLYGLPFHGLGGKVSTHV